MVVLDNPALFGERVRRLKLNLGSLVAGIALGAALLALGAIVARGFSENGFRLASQFAWRYASFIFFLALIVGPLCRIAAWLFPPLSPPESLSRRMVWGFCASYGIYLVSVFVPNAIRLSAGATLMVLFGGGVVMVMAITAAPAARLGKPALLPNMIRRALLGISTAYFWLCYALMALARISGPHRPYAYYGVSLCLMIAGLIARYADRWFVPRDEALTA